jgi:hypothetical protein
MKKREIKVQKITLCIPRDLLQAAMKITGKGITETVKIALQELTHKFKK